MHTGGVGEYRELCGYGIQPVTVRQWGKSNEFTVIAALIPRDVPLTKVSVGGINVSEDDPSVCEWTAQAGSIDPDTRQKVAKVDVKVRYDFQSREAVLLNTGAVLPLKEGKVYTVFLDEEFSIERFAAIDPSEPLEGVHPDIAEVFPKLRP